MLLHSISLFWVKSQAHLQWVYQSVCVIVGSERKIHVNRQHIKWATIWIVRCYLFWSSMPPTQRLTFFVLYSCLLFFSGQVSSKIITAAYNMCVLENSWSNIRRITGATSSLAILERSTKMIPFRSVQTCSIYC